MKPTLRKNGKKMLTLTVSHHMTLEDMAYCFMAEYRYDEQTLLNDASTLPKTKVIEKIKDYLMSQGRDLADYQVGDNLSNATIYQVLEVFKQRFKEFNT